MNDRFNDNIDNRSYLNIDNNIDGDKYSLKGNFKPLTEETSAAWEIASKLNDIQNYAFHRWVVQKIGEGKARQLLSETNDDVENGELNGRPVRNRAALFNWKVNKYLNKRKND